MSSSSITCAITGTASFGKHYVLKTTEGEELISPEALFHTVADQQMGLLLLDIIRRVEKLEPQPDPEEEGGQEADGDRVAEAAQQAAAPVKKSAVKKTPAQREASQ